MLPCGTQALNYKKHLAADSYRITDDENLNKPSILVSAE